MSVAPRTPADPAAAAVWEEEAAPAAHLPPADAEAPPAALAAPRSRTRGATVKMVGGTVNLLLVTVQGLLLVPLYLRALGPVMYGAWLASGDILGWLSVLDMGVSGVMTQRMAAAHGRRDHRVLAAYFGTGLLVQLVLVLALLAGALVLGRYVPGWLSVPPAQAGLLGSCFALAAVGAAMSILNGGVSSLSAAMQLQGVQNAAAVLGSVLCIVLMVWMLTAGYGLWALPAGMVARNGTQLVINGAYAVILLRREVPGRVRPTVAVAREMWTLSGPAFLCMVGNAGVGRSESALIAVFLRPEVAAVYALTRRAADIISMFMAHVAASVYPGFAHLLGSGKRERAGEVVGEVQHLYLTLGTAAVAMYLALNRTFITLWVGTPSYAGHLITVLVGVNLLVVGRASLLTYLTGAAGLIVRGSYLIFFEAAARVALMIGILVVAGVPGIPLAGILVTLVSARVALAWLRREVGPGQQRAGALRRWPLAVQAGVLALAAWAGTVRWADTWTGFAGWSLVFAAAVAAVLLLCDRGARALAGRVAAPALARARAVLQRRP
ncbi:MAG TPA: hypothetical protein VEX86_20740 [Longimicrobium sp.]|nr:hypothetical protein [Longimicrobium sp.]